MERSRRLTKTNGAMHENASKLSLSRKWKMGRISSWGKPDKCRGKTIDIDRNIWGAPSYLHSTRPDNFVNHPSAQIPQIRDWFRKRSPFETQTSIADWVTASKMHTGLKPCIAIANNIAKKKKQRGNPLNSPFFPPQLILSSFNLAKNTNRPGMIFKCRLRQRGREREKNGLHIDVFGAI